jgi:hypothetical protein
MVSVLPDSVHVRLPVVPLCAKPAAESKAIAKSKINFFIDSFVDYLLLIID